MNTEAIEYTGEFDAEPAIIQSQKAPESINLTAATQVTIE